MKAIFTLSTVLLLGLASCSFNHAFYKPDKLPGVPFKWMVYTPGKNDTQLLDIASLNGPMTFTDTKHQPIDHGYTVESVTFKSKDGNMLNGWFMKPTGSVTTHTTLLLLHGNGGNVLSQAILGAPFAKRGFQVFVPDYSGYGFSEGKPTRKNVVADATAALEYVHSRPDVQSGKLIIYGQSMGGMLATVVAAQNQGLIDGLVTEGAPTSPKDIAAYQYHAIGFLARLLVKNGYVPKTAIKQFHKPVLIIHSSEDKVAPYRMGQKMFANANAPKSFYEVRHEHITAPLYYADSISARILGMEGR